MWYKCGAVLCFFYLVSSFVDVADCWPTAFSFRNAANGPIKKHNHSQKAVPKCDDTINGIGIDWNGTDTEINKEHYECLGKLDQYTKDLFNLKPFAKEICKTPPMGYHVCLSNAIHYNEPVPIGGPHRPVWVTYGEYTYMPPQRWVHAIEHGAAAFLYDPCADKDEIEHFKSIAKKCLRKHVISPYTKLPDGQLFNIVTFGCRLTLNSIKGQEKSIYDYLRRHAIRDGPEFHIVEDGDYKFGLVEKSQIVSDLKDSKICPNL